MMRQVRLRWAIGVGSLAALGGLVSALVASARPTPSVNVQLVGSLTIAWQGDQARGCAAEGVCGVRGSLQMLAGGSSSASPGPPPIELFDSGAAARVTEASAGGAVGTTCADLVPVDFVFRVRSASMGGLQAVLARNFSNQLPSAGRCAGPVASDLSALVLPARRLGSHGYDLSGAATFGAGPFTVTATSTVRARIGANGRGGLLTGTSTTSSGPLTPVPVTRTALQEDAEVAYRVEGVAGALSTTFAGLAAPLCAPLGACGTNGQLNESFTARGVTLSFFGSRMVKHRVGLRAALADMRGGRLPLFASFGGIPMAATATETLSRPGGATCSDRGAASSLPAGSSGGGHRAVALNLAAPLGSGQGDSRSGDPLRTRCPGPSSTDVLGNSPLASATVPASAIGAPRMTITFRSAGSFSASDYQGARSGSVTLSLVLERAHGGTSRVPVGPSIPARLR